MPRGVSDEANRSDSVGEVRPNSVSITVSKLEFGMPPNYSIVLADKKHLRAIPGIQLSAAAAFSAADVPLEIRYRVTDPDVLDEARAEGRLWIALDGYDHAIGFALLEIMDGLAHLDEIDVHPDHAKQGIGSSLLRATIEWARHERYAAMTLVTFRHLVWNAPFYEKFGFSELERDELGSDLQELLRVEAATGINMQNRIAMQLALI